MSVASVRIAPVSLPVSCDVQQQAVKQHDAQPKTKLKPQIIQSTAADLQRLSHAFNKKLQFVVDHKSNQVLVKVIDKETDKVIREIPPKELQRLHKNLKEAIGLLFNEMV
jgi:flagellar protein FlaG